MGRLGTLTDAVFFIKNLDKEGQKFLRQRIILIKRIVLLVDQLTSWQVDKLLLLFD